MVKQWKAATNFNIAPFNRETVQAHYSKKEDELDCILALETLKLLARNGRMGTIPKVAHRGAIYSRLTNLELTPSLDPPKPLPADKSTWAQHLRTFFAFFPSVVQGLNRILTTGGRTFKGDELCTKNVYGRGVNLVDSGFVSHYTVGPDRDNKDAMLVLAKVFASFKTEPYLVGLRVVAGDPLNGFTCSCTNG